MTILLRMDDKMNRQLTCQISLDDTAIALSHELVHLGFINDVSLSLTYTRKIVINRGRLHVKSKKVLFLVDVRHL